MKILMCHNLYRDRGGEERHVKLLMELLEDRGDDAIPFFYDSQNISEGGIVRKVSAAFNLIYSFESKKRLEEIIAVEQPDVIHIHNLYPLISPSILHVCRASGISVVQSVHNYRLSCINGLYLTHGEICERCKLGHYYNGVLHNCRRSFMESAAYAAGLFVHRRSRIIEHNVNIFITPSRFLKSKLIEAGLPAEKCIYLPHFIQLTDRVHPSIGSYIVYFGRLSYEKGLLTLLKAMKSLEPSWKLRILGEGPDMQKLIGFTRDQNIKNVEFLGFITGDRFLSILEHAMFSVVPSECYENCPYSVLESYAMGKPVIASNLGGLAELVEDGKTGLLFEPGNSNELAERMRHLLENQDMLRQLSISAKRKAEIDHAPASYYRRLIEIYKTAGGV